MSAGVLGTMAHEDGAGIDFTALRANRRARVFAAMEERDIDVLLLGREANARYASGARRIWRAVVTSWMPTCIISRAERTIHLISTWDDGIPQEIPTGHLFGLSWSPDTISGNMARIGSLQSARRIAVDGMSPFADKLLGELAPAAERVDGEALMVRLRSQKLPAEIDCIRTAIAMTEGAVAAVMTQVRPGVREVELKAVFMEEMSRFGSTIPAVEGVFCATPRQADPRCRTLRRIPSTRPLLAGETVVIDAGVMFAGYEGGVGRTVACTGPSGGRSAAQVALYDRWLAAFSAVLDTCTAGCRARDLRQAWTSLGEALPPLPLAMGVGLGSEPPVVHGADGPDISDDVTLAAGSVLALQGYVFEEGIGGCFGREIVTVTAGEAETLTRLDHPLAGMRNNRGRTPGAFKPGS